jgi:cell wall-associated NlpC family hydrolase
MSQRATPPSPSPDAAAAPAPLAARVDPARLFAGYDARHHHLELRRAGRDLAGVVDAWAIDAVRAWAAREGLHARLEAVVARPAVATRAGGLRAGPAASAATVSEVRLGEPVEVVAEEGAWSKVRTGPDRYLGWIPAEHLTAAAPEATHAVTLLRSHAYAAPRVQGTVLARLAWGDRLRLRAEGEAFCEVLLPDGRTGFVPAPALTPLGEVPLASPLETWRPFLETPYVWGGGSAWGIDCSGFVQLLFRMAGSEVPRDADEQHAAGRAVETPEPGDVVCLRGHVGVYLGDDRMVHASGRAMRVVETPVLTSPEDEERFLGWVRFA